MNHSSLLFTQLLSLRRRACRVVQVGLGTAFLVFGLPFLAFAETESYAGIDLTTAPVGYFALCIFVLAYALVMSEEFTHLTGAKPEGFFLPLQALENLVDQGVDVQ